MTAHKYTDMILKIWHTVGKPDHGQKRVFYMPQAYVWQQTNFIAVLLKHQMPQLYIVNEIYYNL